MSALPKVIELPRVPTPAEVAVREMRAERLADKIIAFWAAYDAQRAKENGNG